MIGIGYDPVKSNEFSSWYYQKIRRNEEEKDRIIRENPILALRVFNVFNDEDIGKKFIEAYRDHPQLSHVAYLVARDINHKFAHEYLMAQEVKIPFVPSVIPPQYHGDAMGYTDSSLLEPYSDYWMSNEWDNLVRLMEDTTI